MPFPLFALPAALLLHLSSTLPLQLSLPLSTPIVVVALKADFELTDRVILGVDGLEEVEALLLEVETDSKVGLCSAWWVPLCCSCCCIGSWLALDAGADVRCCCGGMIEELGCWLGCESLLDDVREADSAEDAVLGVAGRESAVVGTLEWVTM